MKKMNDTTRKWAVDNITQTLLYRNIHNSQSQMADDDYLFDIRDKCMKYDISEDIELRRLIYIIDNLYDIRQQNIKRNIEDPNSSYNKIFNHKKKEA